MLLTDSRMHRRPFPIPYLIGAAKEGVCSGLRGGGRRHAPPCSAKNTPLTTNSRNKTKERRNGKPIRIPNELTHAIYTSCAFPLLPTVPLPMPLCLSASCPHTLVCEGICSCSGGGEALALALSFICLGPALLIAAWRKSFYRGKRVVGEWAREGAALLLANCCFSRVTVQQL